MDSDLKAQADALFSELGMNLTTAFNIFVRQSIREGGIPFEISINQPNKETIAAMLEAERIAKDPSEKGRKTKLTVKPTTAFKKDYKLAIKRGLQIELLETVIETLAMGNALPPENRDHDLTGNWRGHRECHIQPDWLLIYRIEGDVLVLTLSRTGTHSDLFGK